MLGPGVAIAICASCLWPTDSDLMDGPGILIDPQALLDTSSLAPSGDNFTWQAHPNANNGTATELRTGSNSSGRAFFQWSQQAIASAVGSGSLVSATVTLTIQSSTGWGPSGGGVGLYRVTKNWTELGSTANCAIDSNTGNSQPDCSGETAWVLNNPSVAPWPAAATDSLAMTNGQTGTVSFNVTADVQAFLSGTSNFGWVVKPVNDAAAADMRFRSRESTSPPALVLTVDSDTSPPPIPDGFIAPDSGQALLAAPPGTDSVLVLRNFIHIGFFDSTSGAEINSVLTRYQAQVAGGIPLLRDYIVQVPDPGPTYAGLDSLMAVIRTEPGVRFVTHYVFRAPIRNPSRFPEDDSQQIRRQALVLTVDSDTAPPAIPDGFAAPDSSQALLATPPGEDSVLVLRNFVNIGFDDSTSGQTIQLVLGRYNAQVAGGIPGLRAYIVEVPDPGSYASLDSLLSVIRTEPGVRFVVRFVFREPSRDPGRYPSDDLARGARRRAEHSGPRVPRVPPCAGDGAGGGDGGCPGVAVDRRHAGRPAPPVREAHRGIGGTGSALGAQSRGGNCNGTAT